MAVIPAQRPRAWAWLLMAAILCLAATAWWVYGDSAQLGFTYDDLDYFATAAAAQHDWTRLVRPDVAAPWASRIGVHVYVFLLRPLLGTEPGPYHVASVVLHVVNALLLLLLVWRHEQSLAGGAIAAALFLVHSASYRAVLWLSAVSLVLGLCFLLLSLLLVWRYLAGDGHLWLAGAAAAFVASALCHQAYAAGAALAAWLALDQLAGRRRVLSVVAAYGLPGLGVVGLERWLYGGSYTGQPEYSLWGVHLVANLAKYAFGLCAGPGFAAAGATPPLTLVWGLGTCGVLALLALMAHRRTRLWAGWTLLATLPFIFWNRPVVFARYFYWPAAGVAALAAVGLCALARWLGGRWGHRRVVPLAAGAVLVAVIVQARTVDRLYSVQYTDEGKYLLFERGDAAAAIPRLRAAMARDPQAPPKVSLWLAWALLQSGEPRAAEAELRALLRRYPGQPQAAALLARITSPRSLRPPPDQAQRRP